jgi:hypothetical protein
MALWRGWRRKARIWKSKRFGGEAPSPFDLDDMCLRLAIRKPFLEGRFHFLLSAFAAESP